MIETIENLMDNEIPLEDYEYSKNSKYINEFGIRVPRVTEILSKMIHSDSLMYWANALGLKGMYYRQTLDKAANVGTIAHSAIEKYLKEKFMTMDNIPFLGFLSWYNMVTDSLKIDIELLMSEKSLSCDWFGGTLDALMKIGNDVYLIDFKTSNHVTFKYFLQLAAYRYMLRKSENIEINGVIVLQLDKDSPGFNEYLLNFSIPDHLEYMNNCEEAFISLVYAYYKIAIVEQEYEYIDFNK